MLDAPKSREELIDELKAVLESSTEDPTTVRYMLRPSNLDKFNDQEIIEIINSYSGINKATKTLAQKKAQYKADFNAAVEEERERLRVEGIALIRQYINEDRAKEEAAKKKQTGQTDK